MDRDNHRIRKITTDGIINTIAGAGNTGFSGGGFNGDDQAGTSTELNKPTDLVIDALGNIIFNDNNNHRVRKLAVSTLSTNNFSKIGVQLYPNPTTSNHSVTIRSQEVINSISIFNAIGQKVKQVNPNKLNYNLNMNTSKSGLYYVKLTTDNNNTAVQKLIID